MQIEESLSHPHFAKQRQLKSQERRKRKAEIVYVSMLSKVLSLPGRFNCQVHKFEIKSKRQTAPKKDKVSGRPAKLNEKKSSRDLEREIKKRRHFFVGITT